MLLLSSARDRESAAKLRAASVELLFTSRFFGLTLYGNAIIVRERAGIRTMRTDGRVIEYDPEWVRRKEQWSIAFDLLHELLHCFHNHVRRCGGRNKKLWNYACDVRVAHDGLRIMRAINPDFELDDDHVPAHHWARDMTVEQIYEQLEKDEARKDEQLERDPDSDWAGGLGVPDDYEPDMDFESNETPEEANKFREQLAQDITQAQVAEETVTKKTIAERYGDVIAERLKEIKACSVPWDILLTGRLASAFGHDTSVWCPPNRRFLALGLVLPTRRAMQESELLLGIDISGSITEEHLKRFRGCVMPAAQRAHRTTIVTFDAVVREVITGQRPNELLKNLKFKTGAHSFTSTVGLFDEVNKRRPSAVAVLTDGYVALPSQTYPAVHWVLTPTGVEPAWGRSYRIQESW